MTQLILRGCRARMPTVLDLNVPITCTPMCFSQYPSPRPYFDPKAFAIKAGLNQFQEQPGGMIVLWYRPTTGTGKGIGYPGSTRPFHYLWLGKWTLHPCPIALTGKKKPYFRGYQGWVSQPLCLSPWLCLLYGLTQDDLRVMRFVLTSTCS